MANHSAGDQMSFIVQWFNTWSEFQKDDFIHIIAPKVKGAPQVNGIVNGMQNLDASGRPPSLFACQVKLFNEWWTNWNEADREKMMGQLRSVDSKFWSEVEAEVNGTRKKGDEDFFSVTITISNNNTTLPADTTVSEDDKVDNNKSNNNCDDAGDKVDDEGGKDKDAVKSESTSETTGVDGVKENGDVESSDEPKPIEV